LRPSRFPVSHTDVRLEPAAETVAAIEQDGGVAVAGRAALFHDTAARVYRIEA
jgi:hypothetical protein